MGSEMDPVRPLISLIVPVWRDDELLLDLVNGMRIAPELAEWVVVAVSPAQRLCDLDRSGAIRLITCDQPSAWPADECRSHGGTRNAVMLSSL
jgi:hypothetical protein